MKKIIELLILAAILHYANFYTSSGTLETPSLSETVDCFSNVANSVSDLFSKFSYTPQEE